MGNSGNYSKLEAKLSAIFSKWVRTKYQEMRYKLKCKRVISVYNFERHVQLCTPGAPRCATQKSRTNH